MCIRDSPQLIHRHGGVVDQPDPADNTARRPLKAADGAACSAHLTEVHPHSTAEFRDLCEVVQRAVDAVQTVRHSVHKAA